MTSTSATPITTICHCAIAQAAPASGHPDTGIGRLGAIAGPMVGVTPKWPKGNKLKDIHCRNGGIVELVPLKLLANADEVIERFQPSPVSARLGPPAMSAFVHAGGGLTVYSVDPLMALSTTGCRKHLHTAFVSLESVPGLSLDDIRP
jgi:hypothetical protein